MPKVDELVKSQIATVSVIPANPGSGPGQAPESSYFKTFWTPASAGVTIGGTFYEIMRNRRPKTELGIRESNRPWNHKFQMTKVVTAGALGNPLPYRDLFLPWAYSVRAGLYSAMR